MWKQKDSTQGDLIRLNKMAKNRRDKTRWYVTGEVQLNAFVTVPFPV